MPGPERKSSRTRKEYHRDSPHRFEHWQQPNQLYFITACCRDHFPAFAAEQAKLVFWDRFDHWTRTCGFAPWVTSLLDTHYHTVGYLTDQGDLFRMMQRLHGSVAKLVNDLLPERRMHFWRDRKGKGREYYDGCLRDEEQYRRSYLYTRSQAVRAGIVRDWAEYPHTRVAVDLHTGLARAHACNAFMRGVPYPRYERA